ncbi:MAG: nuclear transport factor 2 family protein [Bacteroidales bacterium]
MRTIILVIPVVILCMACSGNQSETLENRKGEIVQAEAEFNQMAADQGIPAAFEAFAANDAVILRGDSLIRGKEAIKNYYDQRYDGKDKVVLTWQPDFVEVAASGDLGYTYGSYNYVVTDSLGAVKTHTGTFHTVWQRQTDGAWRYVWD